MRVSAIVFKNIGLNGCPHADAAPRRGSAHILLALLGAFLTLAACGPGSREPLPPEVDPLGDFRLGFNIVVANDVTRAPGSREASEDELTSALRAAMEERIGRYDGDGLYHVGLRIEAYSLGAPGIPILYSPRSVLIIALNIWDDETQEKLNPEPVRITAFESEAGPLVGSGLVRGKEAQLEALTYHAAKEVEAYLEENAGAWFTPDEDGTRTPFVRDPETGRALSEEPSPEPAN